jgi:hypothetical protein
MLFYPATLPLSSKTLNYTAGVIRRHRRAIGSPPRRRLTPGRQALLVLACLRKATYTDRGGRGGTREDCDLTGTRGWTCCRQAYKRSAVRAHLAPPRSEGLSPVAGEGLPRAEGQFEGQDRRWAMWAAPSVESAGRPNESSCGRYHLADLSATRYAALRTDPSVPVEMTGR